LDLRRNLCGGVALCYRLVPETKGKTLEQIERAGGREVSASTMKESLMNPNSAHILTINGGHRASSSRFIESGSRWSEAHTGRLTASG